MAKKLSGDFLMVKTVLAMGMGCAFSCQPIMAADNQLSAKDVAQGGFFYSMESHLLVGSRVIPSPVNAPSKTAP